MFWFKRKKIVVDCFTFHAGVHNLHPIQKASKFYPEWWLNLEKTYEVSKSVWFKFDRPTMKYCTGFTSLYQEGFVIPLWSDYIIETASDGDNKYFDFIASEDILGPGAVSFHNPAQYGHAKEFEDLVHVKINSPWHFVEKTGVKFVWTQPTWNHLNSNIIVPPGVMDFKYQTATNINIFIQNKEQRINIEHDTPMVHLIPISEHDVEIRNHLVSREELKNIEDRVGHSSSFINKHQTNKNIIDKKKKCPFHF